MCILLSFSKNSIELGLNTFGESVVLQYMLKESSKSFRVVYGDNEDVRCVHMHMMTIVLVIARF